MNDARPKKPRPHVLAEMVYEAVLIVIVVVLLSAIVGQLPAVRHFLRSLFGLNG